MHIHSRWLIIHESRKLSEPELVLTSQASLLTAFTFMASYNHNIAVCTLPIAATF